MEKRKGVFEFIWGGSFAICVQQKDGRVIRVWARTSLMGHRLSGKARPNGLRENALLAFWTGSKEVSNVYSGSCRTGPLG